ncbi:MotA/TolQ/ExbB proton channel family protein [Coraliomargarita akajimensis]|uniref:MotA/TolQ/ExbB proton channel n=1 Tax=Coraliomargarita akajimensis (strain DSM 45221 / IAM 15411 / JCM 23193 / KCTC 12865 / 04OKA010-24) TaxID=583355 RepID=D5EQG4_CORAD|nr:MotA/TolQ/ExbB proton channel family protein [Coraliomargarita akajimensis]ADE55778.1 MotA/TolQ/ExbB proton channel [Coraliomargarita akajimensis DSM 45221]
MSLAFLTDTLYLHLANSPNVFTYFAQSNFAGKIVILILVVCSVLAWSVMLGKYMDMSRLRSQNQRYERLLSRESHLLALDPSRPGKGAGPYYNIVREGLEAFFRYGGDLADPDTHRATLRMGHVENALQRGVADQTIRYEAKMVLLGSIVTGAPFLGLLGTVWGVMDAFGGMAGSGSASLQSLAPGVSGALLTTVAGLVVAIPSVFGYNYLLQQTKISVVELENFASTVADRIELEAQAAVSED